MHNCIYKIMVKMQMKIWEKAEHLIEINCIYNAFKIAENNYNLYIFNMSEIKSIHKIVYVFMFLPAFTFICILIILYLPYFAIWVFMIYFCINMKINYWKSLIIKFFFSISILLLCIKF